MEVFYKVNLNMELSNLTRIALGCIGEDLPNSHFTNVLNLNSIHHNFPIFDHLALLDGEVYVFSTKARKKIGANGKINASYNILYNSDSIARKFKKALDLFVSNGYDIHKIHYCFIVAPLEMEKPCTYYWGEITELDARCTTENILDGKITRFAVPMLDSNLSTYKVFGQHTWHYINTKYLSIKNE